jgi:hypothetical protein
MQREKKILISKKKMNENGPNDAEFQKKSFKKNCTATPKEKLGPKNAEFQKKLFKKNCTATPPK